MVAYHAFIHVAEKAEARAKVRLSERASRMQPVTSFSEAESAEIPRKNLISSLQSTNSSRRRGPRVIERHYK